MIRYAKGVAPAELTKLAATPGIDWEGLGKADRDPIRTALVRDQGGLCAYCQRRITAYEDPTTSHSQMKIEHWIPRADSTEHHLTWSNLLGVCLGASRKSADGPTDRMTHHCDTSRGDHKLFLHPVQGQGPDPREHLRYTKGGEVKAAEGNARVDEDIRALNLNAWRLQSEREVVFEELWKRLERSGFATSELRRFARMHRIVAGTIVPEHAEFLRYHLLKKLRSRGEAEQHGPRRRPCTAWTAMRFTLAVMRGARNHLGWRAFTSLAWRRSRGRPVTCDVSGSTAAGRSSQPYARAAPLTIFIF